MNLDGVGPDSRLILVLGSEPVLVNEAVLRVQHLVLGDDDPSLVLEVIGPDRLAPADGAANLGPLVDAAATAPFLTERRVVVGRGLGRFSTKDAVAPLVAYLADPLPSTVLVLAWEKPADNPGAKGGRPPKSLLDAVAAAGGVVVDTSPPTRDLSGWVRDEAVAAGLTLDASAVALLVDHLGQQPDLLPGLLVALVGAHGGGARLGDADVAPYLGGAGDVAPWDLTDAIDRGDVAGALATLDRMVAAGRHPLAILATLHGHYQRMLALDGADVRDEKGAAALLGMTGSTFPARKALEQVRRLGSERIAEFTVLLADADLDLKGRRHTRWEGGDDAVVQVLVARLASRSPRGGVRKPAGRRAAS